MAGLCRRGVRARHAVPLLSEDTNLCEGTVRRTVTHTERRAVGGSCGAESQFIVE